MRLKNVVFVLSAAGALYVGLALRARPHQRPGVSGVLTDPVPPALAETSGTRLKAKLTTGSDGSKLYDSEILHDSALDVDCAFHKASDGMQRCLPIVEPEGHDGWASILFLDDKCMNGIVGITPAPLGCPQPTPKYVYQSDFVPKCGATAEQLAYHVFEVGALDQSPNGPRYVRNGAGMCVPGGAGADNVFYTISAEVAPSTFVAGTASTEP